MNSSYARGIPSPSSAQPSSLLSTAETNSLTYWWMCKHPPTLGELLPLGLFCHHCCCRFIWGCNTCGRLRVVPLDNKSQSMLHIVGIVVLSDLTYHSPYLCFMWAHLYPKALISLLSPPLLIVWLPSLSSGADAVSWTHQETTDVSVHVSNLWSIEGMIPLMVNISRCRVMHASSCKSGSRNHLHHLLASSESLHLPRVFLLALGPSLLPFPLTFPSLINTEHWHGE